MLTFSELQTLVAGYDAYLLGGGAIHVLTGAPGLPRDWDVLVEGETFPPLPDAFELTSFGGRRYPELGLDIWLGSIGATLCRVPWKECGVAIQLSTGVVIGTAEYFSGQVGLTGRGQILPHQEARKKRAAQEAEAEQLRQCFEAQPGFFTEEELDAAQAHARKLLGEVP